MSVAAKPITTLYLSIDSPFLIVLAAILYPAVTWLRQTKSSDGTGVPIATSMRAITTLSAGCNRITGPVTVLLDISIIRHCPLKTSLDRRSELLAKKAEIE